MQGAFLERARHKNVNMNNQLFHPFDLRLGKAFTVNNFSFYLVDCNDVTRKWYAAHAN